MSQFWSLILMAIIVEGLITYAKTFFVGGKFQWQMLVGIVVGVLVALVYNIDVFVILGINAAVPFVGSILTGILISRGSNYIFDLIKAIQSIGGGVTAEPLTQSFAPLINLTPDSSPAATEQVGAVQAAMVKANTALDENNTAK